MKLAIAESLVQEECCLALLPRKWLIKSIYNGLSYLLKSSQNKYLKVPQNNKKYELYVNVVWLWLIT